MRRPRSIRTRLLALALAVALPAAGLVAYSIMDAWREARETAYREVQTLADDVAGKLDLILRDNEAMLARLARLSPVKALDPRAGSCATAAYRGEQVIEAMSSHRPYRPGLGVDMALAEIERRRGTAYDAVVADTRLALFRDKGYTIPA